MSETQNYANITAVVCYHCFTCGISIHRIAYFDNGRTEHWYGVPMFEGIIESGNDPLRQCAWCQDKHVYRKPGVEVEMWGCSNTRQAFEPISDCVTGGEKTYIPPYLNK